MRGIDLLKGKNWTVDLDIFQEEVHLFHKVPLKAMPEVLFVAKQTLKINKDHHNPPEGVVVAEGNTYPADLAPGGRLQSYYQVWRQKECDPMVALILKHGYRIILAQPIKLSHTPTIHSSYANPQKQTFLLECVQEMLRGAHLENLTVSGIWSDTEANLHINILELKAVFLAIRSFQTHLMNKRVLVASDYATIVSYLNKQGGTHSLEMCLIIWRLMAFCNPRANLLMAQYIQGCLNLIADSLSHKDKIIQTEWSLHPKIFQRICQIWHRPMVDMFATKMNNKPPLYVCPVPDPNAMAVDALNILWEALDGYAYCPIALIPKMIKKMRTYAC